MNELKKEKIKRFLNDEVMAESVRDAITSSFLKPSKVVDVNFLAASRIAIDLLGEAWKDLNKFKADKDKDIAVKKQVGI